MQTFQRVLELPRPFRIALIVFLILVLFLLLFPWQTSIVPAWSVGVVDDQGQVVSGINVTQHWQYYLLQTTGHEEQQTTNEAGLVTFPERTMRASLLRRMFARVGKFGKSGVAGRTDPYAAVVIWGSKEHQVETALYFPTAPPPKLIVVNRIPKG